MGLDNSTCIEGALRLATLVPISEVIPVIPGLVSYFIPPPQEPSS